MKLCIRKKKKKRYVLRIIAILIIGVFCSFKLINFCSKRVSPMYFENAISEVKNLITIVINNSINQSVIDEINDSELFDVVKNNNNEIVLIDYNSKYANSYLALVVKSIQDNLSLIENGRVSELSFSSAILDIYDGKLLKRGILFEIPFGSFSNSNLISNIGPKIPVRFNLIRDTSGRIDTDIQEYGINNAFVRVNVIVNVNVNVTLLNLNKTVSVSSSVPISMKIIQGTIPNFYTGGLSNTFYQK